MIRAFNVARGVRTSVLLLVMASLAACGGSSTTEPDPGPYSVGGAVTGLESGEAVTLSNNGGNFLILRTDTTFTFSRKIASGSTFQVAVDSSPNNRVCYVSNGSGTVSRDVSDVMVTCTAPPPAYAVGGSVSGLNGTLVLRNNGGDDLSLTSNGTFSFATKLTSGSSYQVTVYDEPANQDCTVSSASGTVSGTVASVSVNCTTDGWNHPADLAGKLVASPLAMAQDQIAPQVAMDEYGNAIAVWSQSDGSHTQIYMSDYNLTTPNAWTHPTGLADHISVAGTNATSPRVAMGRNGSDNDAVIVWTQQHHTSPTFGKPHIYMSEYRGGTWIHPAALTSYISFSASGVEAFEDKAVAMDDQGNTIIVWRQLDGTTPVIDAPQLYVSEYRGGAWNHPANITDRFSWPGRPVQASPDVAMDNSGNAIIVWRQHSGDGNSGKFLINMREYRGGAWSALVDPYNNLSISPRRSGNFSSPRVAMDNNGNAIMVWDQAVSEAQPHPYYPGSDPVEITHIYKSEYRNGIWVHPANEADNISPAGLNAVNPQVVMNDNGEAIITWEQPDESQTLQLFKSEYRLNAWTHPASLADNFTPNGGGVANSALAMDDNSNAIIAWRQFDGFKWRLYKSEYRAASWRHPVSLLDSINPGVSTNVSSTPAIAMDNSGDALILWSQSDAEALPVNQQAFMSELR